MPDYLDILNALTRHSVPFIVIGGHAVNLHGFTRMTEDTDVVWLRNPDSGKSLLLALTELDAQYIGNEIDPKTGIERTFKVTPAYIHSTHLMMLFTRVGFLDLFDFIPGFPDEDVEQLWSSAVDANGIRYVSLDWLRRMKQAAGRTKDKLDLENLPG